MISNLEKQLLEIENKISKQAILNPSISASNVGWHTEHILLTINRIIDRLKINDPSNYQRSFRWAKLIVFTMNKIPRKRGKAPNVVLPKLYDEESLKLHLQTTKSKIQELKDISSKQYFEHPYFGHLKLKDTIKFLEIHTNHHLEIIKDILTTNT